MDVSDLGDDGSDVLLGLLDMTGVRRGDVLIDPELMDSWKVEE